MSIAEELDAENVNIIKRYANLSAAEVVEHELETCQDGSKRRHAMKLLILAVATSTHRLHLQIR